MCWFPHTEGTGLCPQGFLAWEPVGQEATTTHHNMQESAVQALKVLKDKELEKKHQWNKNNVLPKR